jgi:FkbM family methyltransferase
VDLSWFYRTWLHLFMALPSRLRRPFGKREEFAWRYFFPFPKGKIAVTNCFGQRLHIRKESLGDFIAAFGRPDEEPVMQIITEVPKGGVVLDVGAHIGGFSLIAARAVGCGGKVWAFEPDAKNMELLRENAKLNNLDWLVAVPVALGRQPGTVELIMSDVDTMWATTRSSWADFLHHGTTNAHVQTTEVPMLTLDEFMQKHGIENINLMKIDVEAAEMDVLAGAKRALSEGRVQQVVVEVHSPMVKWDDVAAVLQGHGFQIRDLKGWEMHGVFRSRSTCH